MNKLSQIILDDAKGIASVPTFSKLDRKTILITGATGLIGTYLVASLKTMSDRLKIKPRMIAVGHGKPPSYFKDLLPKDSKIITGDLSDDKFLEKLPRADYIIHAAGYGQPGKFLGDPVKTIKLNVAATSATMEKLKPDGKYLFLSSSEVYSGSKKIPYKEDDIGTTTPMHKRSCYIEGKRCGEAVCAAYHERGRNVHIARTSLVYGPGTRKDDARVLNSFIRKGLTGKIELMDAGKAKRTYCYATDAAEMFWNILLNGSDLSYNVGGIDKITIAGLANKIGKILSVPVIIPKAGQALAGAPEDVWLDLSKIKNEFRKNEFVNLDRGLNKTVEWQKVLYADN